MKKNKKKNKNTKNFNKQNQIFKNKKLNRKNSRKK